MTTLIFHSKEEFEQTVILRFRDGQFIRSISREFRISRNTVREILRRHHIRREAGPEVPKKKIVRASKLDPFKSEIEKLLKKFPAITGQRMLEELKHREYSGGITILRDYLQKIRLPQEEPVIRFETAPGHQSQFDWSPYTIKFLRTGKSDVLCFSYILGFSRRQYIDFTHKRDFFTLIRRHQDAFQYFQGITRECLYDNEKTVVLRWEAGKPVFNPAFTAFITHYNCKPIACRRRNPRTKGKIERPFRYVEGNLLCARDFQDFDDLRATAKWWLSEVSDRHIHDTTKRPPIELFMEEEQESLQPLPAFPYDSSEAHLLLCRSEGRVLFETNRYSVKTGYIGDILTLKATEKEILIYSPELELLAHHERLAAGSNDVRDDPNHFGVKRDRYGLEPVREAFLALGEAAEEFLKGLRNKFPKNCGHHVRFILRMKEQFNSDDIHKALIHAMRYQAFDGKSIERILKAKALPRTLESIRNERARQQLENALPKIMQRPLSEYGELFEKKEPNDENNRDRVENQNPPGNSSTERDSCGS